MTTPVADQLRIRFGLDSVNIRSGLTQDELFHAAIAGDRGRTRFDGGEHDQKAFATALGSDGPLIFYSDPSCTGRPVQDTFAVAWPELVDDVWWKSDFNKLDPDRFPGLLERVLAHLNKRQATVYTADVFCGWDPEFAIPYRLVSEYATHAFFANIMFPKGVREDADRESIGWTMINVPSFRCDPDRDGTRTDRAVIMDLRNRLGLVLGRADYCGVVKKTMFTVMNFVLPDAKQLTMHCSANVDDNGNSAILFGLSGTGKTTLSADPDRSLIGDDEHVWTESGVSNFEDGCYAKLIDLDKDAEPIIADALSQGGTLIENVPALPGRDLIDTDPQDLDLTDDSITENTRFAYPLACNPHVAPGAKGPHPSTIVLLTADAFGVLPPVSILNRDEVMYHFVMGFTSKLAGTEVGVVEPQATFSSCFGAPFMSHKPSVYAELLAHRMEAHQARCILLNTGWSGGPHGVGERMSIAHTRALLNAALNGDLDSADTVRLPTLGLRIPASCPGVPDEVLNPRNTWSDPDAYDEAAVRLRDLFRQNYEKQDYASLGIQEML
ncbi:MAG: phosphoenolpyruvate carboxykinase (ATP) [Acidimicrobiia bacterium]|nr:phosphoenolpyruvate carboxykinase (ATP) [Acidimicrobiia bacterium]MCY4433622.1 phosphoenolpyruvate carboxykinase (ATP) [bacterium]